MRAAAVVVRRRRFVGSSAILALLLLLLFPALWQQLSALMLSDQLRQDDAQPADSARSTFPYGVRVRSSRHDVDLYADLDRVGLRKAPSLGANAQSEPNQRPPDVLPRVQLAARHNTQQPLSGGSDPTPSPECAAHTFLSAHELLSAAGPSPNATSGQPPASGSEPHSPAALVRVVHQSWKTRALPSRFAAWADSWCACLPGWRRVLWTDADNERLVREHFAWFYARWKAFRKPINRVDALRYTHNVRM